MLGKLCLEGVIILFIFPFPFPIRFSVSLSFFFFFFLKREVKQNVFAGNVFMKIFLWGCDKICHSCHFQEVFQDRIGLSVINIIHKPLLSFTTSQTQFVSTDYGIMISVS